MSNDIIIAHPELRQQLGTWWGTQDKWKSKKAFSQATQIGERTLRDYFAGRNFPKGRHRLILFEFTGIQLLSQPQAVGLLDQNSYVLEGIVNNKNEHSGKAEQTMLLANRSANLTDYKTIRVAVSGDVNISKLECEILDTREFQRLHAIHQLGTSYLIYPSANHNRFEHSLGTLYEAQRIIYSIQNNPKSSDSQKYIDEWDKVVIRLSALLHDITHIPFGHSLEDETKVIKDDHDTDGSRQDWLITESSIGKKLKSSIGEEKLKLLLQILSSKHDTMWQLGDLAYLGDIVKNTLCADLLDYLRRDIYFCNLQEDFGERFLKYLYLAPVQEEHGIEGDIKTTNARRLLIRVWKKEALRHRRDVLSELVDLLRTRYSLGEKVYFHHAKMSSSAMISRAVWSAMNASVGPKLTLKELAQMGDFQLLSWLLEKSKDTVATRLAQNLQERQLYKSVYSLSRIEAEAVPNTNWVQTMTEIYHSDPQNRTAVEDQLASLCNLEPGDVLIYCPNPDMAKKYARMLVEWKSKPVMLEKIDDPVTKPALDTINRSHELLWGLQVFVKSTVKEKPKVINHLYELCQWKFAPTIQAQDSERRLECVLRSIVNEQIGQSGTAADSEAVIGNLVAKFRGGSEQIMWQDIEKAIKEIKKR